MNSTDHHAYIGALVDVFMTVQNLPVERLGKKDGVHH